jgi:serine protease
VSFLWLKIVLGYQSERLRQYPDESAKLKRIRGEAINLKRSLKKDEESSRQKKKMKRRRVFIEFQDEESRNAIIEKAHTVIKDYKSRNSMVVEMDEDTQDELIADKIIKTIHNDEPVEGYSSVHREILHTATEIVPWGIEMIQADQLPIGPYPVKVCIADTGYGLGHPDLPNRSSGRLTGDDAVSKLGDVWPWSIDFNGHGTHLAGTIAALGNNKIGVKGAGNIPLHITRSLDDKSSGFESDVIDAIDQCIAAGAKIINLSLGGDVMTDRSKAKYDDVVNKLGIMVVAASGNQGLNKHAYPASHPAVISVSAVYQWKNYWEGSNYSDQVELSAPGHNIISTTTTLSAVHTIDYSFTAIQITGSRTRERSSILFNCGAGNTVCTKPQTLKSGGICIMSKDRTPLRTMILNCQRSGALGAVIFEANAALQQSAYSARVDIPAVVVNTDIGITLMNYEGTRVSIGFHESDQPEWTYASFQGTSMAVPHVAAAAALVWSYFPSCTNHEIRFALAITAEDRGMSGCDMDYGHGIVQALNAKKWLESNPCGSGNIANPLGGCAVTKITSK